MSDELLEIVDNIKQPSVWIRVLFMIVFGVASYLLILPLIIILSIAQALFTLITGEPNANLKYFAASLELYVAQIVRFLTYLSEEKPFPFSDFPEVEDSSLQDGPVSAATTAEKAGEKKDEKKDEKVPSAAAKTGADKPGSSKAATSKASAKKAAARKTVKKAAKKSATGKDTGQIKSAAEKGAAEKDSGDQDSPDS